MNHETFVADVRQFTEAVGCTTDTFNVRQTAFYTGMQLEEMAEKLAAILGEDNAASRYLETIGEMFKSGEYDHQVARGDRAAMLDADVDISWVSVGSSLSQGADVLGAMQEVAHANLDKLIVCSECHGAGCEVCGGRGLRAMKDINGKVIKPATWTAPDLTPFVKAD